MCCSGDFYQVSACGLTALQVSPLRFCTIHCCQIGKAPPRLSHPISIQQLCRLNCKLVGTQLLKVRLCSIRISCFHLWLRENIKIKQWIIISHRDFFPTSSKKRNYHYNKQTNYPEQRCILLFSAELTENAIMSVSYLSSSGKREDLKQK